MKFFKNTILFVAVALFASCSTDVDTPQLNNPDDFVAPVINDCSDVIVNADNSKEESVIFTWKAAEFGLPVQILYSLYLTSGETTALLGTSSSTALSVMKSDINGVAINSLGIPANETAEVTAYVTAQIYGTDEYEPMSSNISNKFEVTTFAAPLSNLYVVGFFNGWKEGQAVEIWETSGGTNIYQGIYNFINDEGTDGFSGFKILTERSWNGGNWGYDAFKAGNNITSSDDGNLMLPSGIWQISVNKTVMTIDAVAVSSVGIIGSFNDWVSDDPLIYDAVENVWVSEPLTFGADGDFLIRLNGSWDFKYGVSGSTSMAIPGGIELAKGGDNIPVDGAGTYVMKLHANRTPYVLELVKQ